MALKSLAVLSHKGGVGKTSIAVNLAVHLAKMGKNVCLLDNDFAGPSLVTFFEPKVKWINQYLLDDEPIEDCLQDVSEELNLPGKLYVGFAHPRAETVRVLVRMDQRSSIGMLQNLIKLRKTIVHDPYNVEYFIIDSTPGSGYTTVNVMITATEGNLFIVKLSNADIMGTSQMISGLYKQLGGRFMVLANLIPQEGLAANNNREELSQLTEDQFAADIGERVVEFLRAIPTDQELQVIEFEMAMKTLRGQESNRVIHTLEQPDHVFSKTLADLIPVLFKELS